MSWCHGVHIYAGSHYLLVCEGGVQLIVFKIDTVETILHVSLVSVYSYAQSQLLQTSLKRGKFDTSSEEQLEMLDPFVSLLSDSLTSRHIKVLSRTLQCLVWVVRMPLPSLDTHIHAISSRLFDILKRYARAGAATVGSNRDLALAGFKVEPAPDSYSISATDPCFSQWKKLSSPSI